MNYFLRLTTGLLIAIVVTSCGGSKSSGGSTSAKGTTGCSSNNDSSFGQATFGSTCF